MESLPLRVLMRKLLYVRCKYCARRAQVMLSSHQGRLFACKVMGVLVLALVLLSQALHLPDPDDEARRPQQVAPSLPTSTSAVAVPPSPPSQLADPASYAAELRRRAADLNRDIARFKSERRASELTKQQRLRRTAEQLQVQLGQLKQARHSAFTGADHAAAAAATTTPTFSEAGIAVAATTVTATAAARPSSPPCAPHPEFRVAILMPWVSPVDESRTSAARFPPWLPQFVATARRSSMLVDWVMLHEGPLGAAEMPLAASARNVKFVDVGFGGLAKLIARGLSEQLQLPAANVSAVGAALRFMLQRWPRLVAEYKPAFGTIFKKLLENYTHWYVRALPMIPRDLARRRVIFAMPPAHCRRAGPAVPDRACVDALRCATLCAAFL